MTCSRFVLLWITFFIAAATPVAAQRLPVTAVPIHYDLHVAPDLAAERFEGEVTIRVRVLTRTTRFVLNAADLEIESARVTGGGREREGKPVLDEAAQTVTIQLVEPVPTGTAEIHIAYRGTLNRELRGFYISEANNRKYAVTQLEATDARRMFPSFDEPGYKATFAISATIEEDDTAISNGPVVATRPGPGPGRKTIVFGTTPPMSSYLVAMAVGDFVCTDPQRVGQTPVRICSTPGGQTLTGFALDAADATLSWFNQYFAIDYPFGKLDLVAIPDFAAGAMENTGAIFFREALLLVRPDAALAARKRVAVIVAHEIAHQWFGNLVTMKWWDDLWLNEGFATWMETKSVAAWKPQWNLEVDELQATHRAMSLDALRSTRPVRTAAETPEEINELFDPIAYEKAAAVLGMVESYVGADAFQAGVNAYLQKYKYANAAADDFWNTLTLTTRQPVDRIMRSFVNQPGVPLITVQTACTQGNTRVELTQERFFASGASGSDAPVWAVPVCLETLGDGDADRCELLEERRAALQLPGCARWVMGNKDAEGYYRTRHGEAALERLVRANAELDSDERLALVADQWAVFRAGLVDVPGFMDVAAALALDVRAPDVVDALGARLQFLHEYVSAPESRDAFEEWVRQQFEPRLEALTRVIPQDEQRQRQLALTLALVGGTGRDPEVLADARRQVDDYLEDPEQSSIPGTILDVLVSLAALRGDERLYERYRARAEASSIPEERYRFLYALAAFRAPDLLRRTFDYALSPAVRVQDRATLIAGVLGNPEGRRIAWEAIQRRWNDLQEGLGAFGGVGRIVEALGAFCSREALSEIRGFFELHPVPSAERTLQQTFEDVQRCAALQETQAPKLRQWLTAAR